MHSSIRWTGLVVVAACSACVSTRMATTWTTPAAFDQLPSRVLVSAAMPSEAVRRQIEQKLVSQLRAEGVDAVAYTSLDTSGAPPKPETLSRTLQSGGFDGLLASRFVGVSQHPSSSRPYRYGGYGPPYYPYPYLWDYGYGAYWTPVTGAQIETSLYSVGPQTRDLLWSGASSTWAAQSGAPTMSSADISHYCKVVIDRLNRDLQG